MPCVVGIMLVVTAFIVQEVANKGGRSTDFGVLFPTAVWLFVPEMIWLCLVPFLHWSERYRGRHKMLWLWPLVFETGRILS